MSNSFSRLGLATITAIAILAPALAQSEITFTAQIDSRDIALGDQVNLQLTLTGASEQLPAPELPAIPGFNAMPTGTQSSFSIVNGVSSSSFSYNYVLTALAVGAHRIPPISIEVDGKTYSTERIDVVVVQSANVPGPPRQPPPASIGQPGFPQFQFRRFPGMPGMAGVDAPRAYQPPPPAPPPTTPKVFIEATVNTQHPYVNEPVIYTFKLFHNVGLARNPPPNFEPPECTGFLREELGQKTTTEMRDGQNFDVSEVRSVMFPSTAGQATIGATRLTCRLQPRDVGDPSFMFEMITPVKELVTKPITVDVMPLPTKGRPDDFSGAVGQYTLKAKVTPDHIKEGESATLEVTAEGNGHPDTIADMTLPPYPNLKVYGAKEESSTNKDQHPEELRGTKIWRFPLVAAKAGHYTLPGIRLSYFDPRRHSYQLAEAAVPTLDVAPDPTAHPEPTASATPGASASPAAPNHDKLEPEDMLHPVKALASDLAPESPPVTGRSWFWILQCLPLTCLLSFLGLRRLVTAMQYQLSQRYHKGTCSRCARAARRLPGNQVDQATGLIFDYLKEKTGHNLSTLSLVGLEEKLRSLGVCASLASQTREQLERLETLRYAPPGESHADSVGAVAADLIEKLERELR